MKFRIATLALAGCALLAAGVLALQWQSPEQPGAAEATGLARLFPAEEQSLEQRLQKMEAALRDTHQIQNQLFELVEEMRSRLEDNPGSQRPPAQAGASGRGAAAQADYRDRYQRHREMQYQRLVDAGLAPERAEFILSVQERLQHEQMKLAYEFHHTADKSSEQARALQQQLELHRNPHGVLEQELSEREFELYQQGFGYRQEMRVNRVLEGTPAQSAGLQPGDRILSYNGKRVYHFGELQSQVMQVEPGKTVPVEIQREGSSGRQTIYVPSGPLGIQG